ncbi:hypothetical protein P7C70_g6629, partial [Phenoliferia sp. Uapishka_3]
MIFPFVIALLLPAPTFGRPALPFSKPTSRSLTNSTESQWVSTGPNFFIPGDESSSSSLEKRALGRHSVSRTPRSGTTAAFVARETATPSNTANDDDDPTITARAIAMPPSLYGKRSMRNLWNINPVKQALAASLLVSADLMDPKVSQIYDGNYWRISAELQSTAERLLALQSRQTATGASSSSTMTKTSISRSTSSSVSKTSSSSPTPISTTAPSSTTTKRSTTKKSTTSKKTSSTKSRTSTSTSAPTATITGKSWKQKTGLSTIGAFLVDVKQIGSWAFGAVNAGIVSQVPASAYTSGKSDGTNNEAALSALYPKGSYSPGNTPLGGIGFYGSPIDVSAANNVSFSYSVFFPADFEFVKGGKLPGLYGGKKGCSGGDTAENCFSARLMWRTGGLGELYLYAPREKQVTALCTLGPLSYCNTVDGMSIGRGSWTFKAGEWTNIRQDIWLNTPGKADGGFNIWVNDDLVLSSSSVYYRNSPVGTLFNGTAPVPIPLIDYDNLPSSVIIPNGGLTVMPNSTVSIASAPAASASSTPADFDVRRVRRSVIQLAGQAVEERGQAMDGTNELELQKRAVVPVVGFLGFMHQTFFGGSSTSWASPKIQYTYYNRLGLAINL